MSTEENKALILRWFEEDKKRNWAGIEELYAPDYVFHGAVPPGFSPDLAGSKQLMTALWTAFPDEHSVSEDVIAEGDKVVCRWSMRATHQGDFIGIPPTGKHVSWTGIGIYRIEDDKIVEAWGSTDNLGLMQQLGAIPQMAQAGA
jgi:steroid delta-isomerase-like uncharacterized protein